MKNPIVTSALGTLLALIIYSQGLSIIHSLLYTPGKCREALMDHYKQNSKFETALSNPIVAPLLEEKLEAACKKSHNVPEDAIADLGEPN